MPVDPKLITWVVAGVGPGDRKGTVIDPIPDAVRAAVAAALPDPPPPIPLPAVPPAPTIIPRGKPGLLWDGRGGPVRVSGLWLRAEGRDPTAGGFDFARVDPDGPDGLTVVNASEVLIEDCRVEGFEQGIVVKNVSGPVTLRRVWPCDNWAKNVPDRWKGQGFYGEGIRGTLALEDCLFDRNGWRPGLPRGLLDVGGHGVYHQRGCGPVSALRCGFTRNANAGLQMRNGGRVQDPFFADNATNVIAFGRGDTAEIVGGACLGAHHYFDGSNWTGARFALSYAAMLRLRDVVAAWPATPPPYPKPVPPERSFDMGCVGLSSHYDQLHADWADPDPQIDAQGVVVCGWPGRLLDKNNTPLPANGFDVRPLPLAGFDMSGLCDRVRAGQLSVADAVKAVRAAAG